MILRTSPRRFDSHSPWRDSVCEYFVELEVNANTSGAFINVAATDSIGCLQVTELLTSAQRVRRTRKLADRSEQSLFKATLQLSGRSEIVQDQRSAILNPGEWGLYDTARPYEVTVEQDAHFLVLQICARQMTVWQPYLARAVARTFSASHGSARVAMDTMRVALAENPGLSSAATRDISNVILQMIGLNLCEQSGNGGMSAMNEVRQAQFRKISQYIATNLHDPELSATGLAARFRVSRRYLHKLFADHELTPADYILRTRLERCQSLLADKTVFKQISEIAYQHGFSDSTAFSHAFRRRYGISPTEWRRQQILQ